jgi:nitroreductase
MDVRDAIRGRFSVRSYSAEGVSEEDLSAVLESARLSPSAKNRQDWRFVVVRNPAMRKKLAEAAKGQMFVGEAPAVIVCCGIDIDYIMTCGQPSYPIDVAIAMENMALTAHELGLGVCWLGAFYEHRVKELLGIPKENVRVVGMLTLGHPAVQSPPKRREPLETIVRYERWS